MIGRAFLGLGVVESAEPQLRSVLTIRRRLCPEEHPLVGECVVDIVELLQDRGEFEAALQLADEASANLAGVPGAEDLRADLDQQRAISFQTRGNQVLPHPNRISHK